MELPTEFFTETSISTFGGATLAVFLIMIVGRRLFKLTSLFVPFIASILISFVIAGHDGQLADGFGWLLAGLNSLLLFCAVTGMNETVADAATPKPAGQKIQQGVQPTRWFQSMFNR
ncbi:MAG: hypothetical protein JJT87_12590 [Halomonas sp.]|nr:hypothetical protein [Halomonas sp.]MCC5902748.1 hypothetical protein [Halomonas sp.]